MKYIIEINLDDDALVKDMPGELSRILATIAKDINDTGRVAPRKIKDLNGNVVGIAGIVKTNIKH